MIKKKATRQNSIIRNVTTKGKKKENKNEVDNPFDMVNVTNLKLVLRSASAGGDVIEFVWRVQVRIAPSPCCPWPVMLRRCSRMPAIVQLSPCHRCWQPNLCPQCESPPHMCVVR